MPAAAGDDAQEDLGLTEAGIRRRHPEVAAQRQLEPAAERVAGDRRDRRAAELQGVGDGLESVGDPPGALRFGELAHVGSGREDPVATPEDECPGRIGREPVIVSPTSPSIPTDSAFAFGPVQGHERHAVVAALEAGPRLLSSGTRRTRTVPRAGLAGHAEPSSRTRTAPRHGRASSARHDISRHYDHPRTSRAHR